jgi:Tfp pilus assembly protein PilW
MADSINTSSSIRSGRAFTLLETLIGASIGSLIAAGVLTTYIFSIRSFSAISNYVEIHRSGRSAVDYVSRDARGVSSVYSSSSSNLVVKIPTAFDNTGSVISNKTVTYSYSSGILWRTDSSTGKTTGLASNVVQLTFSLYDRLGSNTVVLSNAKGVQLNIKLRKTVTNQIQSEDYLSARLDMRNIR